MLRLFKQGIALRFIIHRMLYQGKDADGIGGDVDSCMTVKEQPMSKPHMAFVAFLLPMVTKNQTR